MRTDEDLVRSFVQQDEGSAFDELVRRHLGLIRRLLYGILAGNEEDIQDAQQEVLLALYRGLRGFRGRAAFRTWLYRFVMNRGIDHLRRITRARARDERLIAQTDPGADPGKTDPAQGVLLEERRREIAAALQELRREQRVLLVMREVEGMEVRDMAQALGIPAGTVKSRLHRSRSALAEILRRRGIRDDR